MVRILTVSGSAGQEISKDAFPEDTIQKPYTYDKRGNLTGEYQDGELMHGYAFNSMNRLEKAWDSEGKEAEYFYNALGQRTGRSAGEETEEYLLDLTKPYHNLLERQKGKHRQTFYWDMNVSAMEDENRTLQYYLQDELGSPLRVLYRSGSGEAYGYDEYGADLYDPEKKPGAGRQYSRQGEHQPFGFTGYRYDDISGTYFAQAREYQPGVGRFTAEDLVKGKGVMPQTLNQFGYCLGNPLKCVDFNGKEEDEYYIYYLNNMDGAKIFGHSSILLESSDGSSEFYTYMGTGDTMSALKGEDSLGYMGHESLNKEEMEEFLKSGDIDVKMPGDWYNHDNYDKALKKSITAEEYYWVMAAAEYYVNLYNEGSLSDDINSYLENTPNAIYNLYSHNCDTVAGAIVGLVDPYFITCQEGVGYTTLMTAFM